MNIVASGIDSNALFIRDEISTISTSHENTSRNNDKLYFIAEIELEF